MSRAAILVVALLLVIGGNGLAEDLQHYTCFKASGPITVDGRLDEPSWQAAPWSDPLVGILDGEAAQPEYETRVALLWDDTCLYVAFDISEQNVWATLTVRDSKIWKDNDVELFIDGGDTYYEFEINAFNTIYEVFWVWDDARVAGSVFYDAVEWDPEVQNVISGSAPERTLNKQDDVDEGWTVELALPWAGMELLAGERSLPPKPGDVWRIDCSRFEHVPPELAHHGKTAGWTWNKHGRWDSHMPWRFTYVHFSEKTVGALQK